jgi:hypothetical protein
MPLSTIFKFYWSRKPVYPENTPLLSDISNINDIYKFSPDLLIHHDDYITLIMSKRDKVKTDAC